jgi:hypothetical protein
MLKYDSYNLLVEKRIGQIVSNLEIKYSLDIDKTQHSYERSDGRDDLEGYDNTPITNNEVKNLVYIFSKKIAENIFHEEIHNNVPFVIKSKENKLSLAIQPIKKEKTWWILKILTVFRESDIHSLRVGYDQLVLTDDDI